MSATYTKHAKTAGYFGDVWNSVKGTTRALGKDPAFMGGVALMGAGAVMGGVGKGVDHLMEARRKSVAFKSMMELHPHLKQRDPKMVARIFNSVHHANPHMARDPMVAGAFVDQAVEASDAYQGQANQGLATIVKDLSGIRSSISQAKSREPGGFGASLGAATKQIGESAQSRAMAMGGERQALEADKARFEREHQTFKDKQHLQRITSASKALDDQLQYAKEHRITDIDPAQFQEALFHRMKTSSNRLLAAVLR